MTNVEILEKVIGKVVIDIACLVLFIVVIALIFVLPIYALTEFSFLHSFCLAVLAGLLVLLLINTLQGVYLIVKYIYKRLSR